ncbi:hypothetical protein [Hymenobacter convexus]|uniref:hypothetical protein n=1 Tax=Hymenobacter sp. CA1UV-4 TaxID=3063782 RepID=UPI002712BAF9|nr:hypothetical protein [Hymenobacter sp. CA1UV-4]MDO7850981.1 hypothetical protein [Hymenobacter sp. CA1UV-4]
MTIHLLLSYSTMKNSPKSVASRPTSTREPATKPHIGTPHFGTFGTTAATPDVPAAAPDPAHAEAAARIEAGGTEAELRAAYAEEDSRYAGGDVFDLKNEQTGL